MAQSRAVPQTSSMENASKGLFKYREAQQFLCGLRGATEADPLSPKSLQQPRATCFQVTASESWKHCGV